MQRLAERVCTGPREIGSQALNHASLREDYLNQVQRDSLSQRSSDEKTSTPLALSRKTGRAQL